MTVLNKTPYDPYAGLMVLDMSQGIAGPYCGTLLQQHGADVVKIEPPAGDWIRFMGGGSEGMTALSVANNLGKRSICIDATKPSGRLIIETLAKRADILIENFRPGVMNKLGLGYDSLSSLNPRLIYLSISGFGSSGPSLRKPATDSVMQAITGMAVANSDGNGRPSRIGIYVPDTISALYAMNSVSAALYSRDVAPKSGGRHIEISLAQSCAAFQSGAILDDFLFSGQHKPPISVPSGIFDTRDGHLVLATLGEPMWKKLCHALQREDWLTDARFAERDERARNAKELSIEVAQIIATRDTIEWEKLLEEADVLYAPVQNYQQFRENPQTQHMKYFGETEQYPYGTIPVPRAPGSSHQDLLPSAPHAGQHTHEILMEFGYDQSTIEDMTNAGVVTQADSQTSTL